MTAIGYCRVSTEDQAKEGVSLDNQKSKMEILVEGEGTLTFCWKVDADYSGDESIQYNNSNNKQ